MKKKFHLAFVSNAQAAAQVVQTLSPAMGIDIEIHVVAMEQAITVAKTLYDDGTDIILGCGSTGKMLQSCLDIPVVTISNIPLAILRALQKAKKYSDTIVLPYYRTIPEWLNVLSDVMNLRLIPAIFHDTKSLISCISKSVENNINCVVGSNIAVKIAKGQGCNGVEVFYSENEIKSGLEEALRLAKVIERLHVQEEFLKNVADCVKDAGIICMSDREHEIVLNSKAKLLLNCKKNDTKYIRKKIYDTGIAKAIQRKEWHEDFLLGVRKEKVSTTLIPVSFDEDFCGSVVLLNGFDARHALDDSSKFHSRYTFDDMVGRSAVMDDLRRQAMLYARTDASVLIQGETGTGKELLAHSIHNASLRRNKPFVALNCAALPETLLESELFGYADGAFTGAKRGGKNGIFAMARGGTVFLDEIADISPNVQVRLLRVLEAREMMRVGGDRIIPVDVRIISSSWKKLGQEVRRGRFRADLYYRLSVLALTLPPLRERKEDIRDIVAAILKRRGLESKRLSEKAYALMAMHSWPGNIRELDILLQRYCLLLQSDGPDDDLFAMVLGKLVDEAEALGRDDLPEEPPEEPRKDEAPSDDSCGTLREQLESCERGILQRALAAHEHNRVNTARSLGISTNTLWRKMNALL